MKLLWIVLAAGPLFAQPSKPAAGRAPAKPLQAQSPSTLNYTKDADGSETVEIQNVSYQAIEGDVPGRPRDEHLLLRKTIHSKKVLTDIGSESTITLEAWRLGTDIHQKPLYSISVSGDDGHTTDNALFVASRGLEEVDWWSVYKLGNGQHLFDTYVPLISFSISRDILETRYVGLEIPEDDAADARLRQPNVIGVLTYASGDRVIREALLTSDDPKRAQLLRSFADVTRTLSVADGPSHTLKLSFTQNYPSAANPVDVLIPLLKDDLDLAHAQLPARVHVSAWKR